MIKLITTLAVLLISQMAFGADYKCQGESVNKSGSTEFKVKASGSDYVIEKSGSMIAKLRKNGSDYSVEISGSTEAKISGTSIYKSGSSWGSVSEAQKIFDCKNEIAAGLWVLRKLGKL